MRQRNDGHPAAAMLLLFSMFAFAFVFHAVTKQDIPVPAIFNTQLAPLTALVAPVAPATSPVALVAPVALDAPATAPVALVAPVAPDAPATAPVALVAPDALATVALVAPVAPDAPATVAPDALATGATRGAVRRAFASAGSSMRAAFKKAF